MTDTDRKKLYHWFDTRVKGLIQIGGTSSNYMFTDGEVSVLIRFVEGGFATLIPPTNSTAWADIQDRMRVAFSGYGLVHGRGYIGEQSFFYVATYEEREP